MKLLIYYENFINISPKTVDHFYVIYRRDIA
jgi:hypothetical protein